MPFGGIGNAIRRAGRDINREVNRAGRDINREFNNGTDLVTHGLTHTIEQAENAWNSVTGDIQHGIQVNADNLAESYQESNPSADFDDCVAIVAAGSASYGASVGGPVGAAIGAGAGIHAAKIACRRIFP